MTKAYEVGTYNQLKFSTVIQKCSLNSLDSRVINTLTEIEGHLGGIKKIEKTILDTLFSNTLITIVDI